MSALLDRYKVFLTHDGDTRQVTPDQDDLIDAFTPEDNQIFFRRRTKNDLRLVKGDFDWIMVIEQSAARCLPIVVEFKLIVPGAADEDDFTGYAYLDDARFDEDRCQVTLKVESEDKYSRLTAIWEREVNFLDGTAKVTCKSRFVEAGLTVIEQIDTDETVAIPTGNQPDFDNPDFPDFHDCWVMITDEVNIDAGAFTATRSARFMREVTIGGTAPAGGGWRSVDGGTKYARSIASVLIEAKTVSNPTLLGSLPLVWTVDQYRRYYAWINVDVPNGYGNGVRLSVVLSKLLSGTGITVKSNFFDINPAGPSPSNSVYDNLKYTNVVIYHRSDVCLPTASNPATIAVVTLKGVLDNIRTLYQVLPIMDGDTMVLEHESFNSGQNGLDLTVIAPEALVGKSSYNYEGKETPEGEDWIHENEESCQLLFQRWAIFYDLNNPPELVNNCIERLGPRKQIFTGGVCNDLGAMLANPERFGNDGITFVDSFIEDDVRYLDANDYFTTAFLGAFNASHGPPGLRVLWNYRRYFEFYRWYFLVTSGLTDAVGISESLIPFKVQSELEIPMVNLLSFDVQKRHKTQYGWGEVRAAEYSRKKGILKLKLAHL